MSWITCVENIPKNLVGNLRETYIRIVLHVIIPFALPLYTANTQSLANPSHSDNSEIVLNYILNDEPFLKTSRST